MTRSVVLVHGAGSSSRTWWRQQADLTDLGWEVGEVDLAGHGDRRDAAPGPLSLVSLAEDLLERLPTDLDLLVGHSLGAVISLVASTIKTDLCRRLFLEDPPTSEGSSPAHVARVLEEEVRGAAADAGGFVADYLRSNPTHALQDGEVALRSRSQCDAARVVALLRAARWDLPQLVEATAVPVHILAASGPGTALRGPDRRALESSAISSSFTAVQSGHGVHRDRPALWLRALLQSAIEEDTTTHSSDVPQV